MKVSEAVNIQGLDSDLSRTFPPGAGTRIIRSDADSLFFPATLTEQADDPLSPPEAERIQTIAVEGRCVSHIEERETRFRTRETAVSDNEGRLQNLS